MLNVDITLGVLYIFQSRGLGLTKTNYDGVTIEIKIDKRQFP